jgi:hypothetical protein
LEEVFVGVSGSGFCGDVLFKSSSPFSPQPRAPLLLKDEEEEEAESRG